MAARKTTKPKSTVPRGESLNGASLPPPKGTRAGRPGTRNVSPSGRTCVVQGCGRPEQAKGLCHTHLVRQYKGIQLQGRIRKHHRLTDAQVAKVRHLRQAKNTPVKQLAAEYGVAKATIQRILSGERRAVSTAR